MVKEERAAVQFTQIFVLDLASHSGSIGLTVETFCSIYLFWGRSNKPRHHPLIGFLAKR